MKSSFDVGQEGWCSYDYNGCIRADRRMMVLTVWETAGGADGGGYVWTDEHGWSADTPESPVSVLPLMLYRYWVDEGPLDLRGARVSVYLRGDALKLFGARCYFWVVGSEDRGRWHYNSAPLEISNGRWADEPNVVTLHNDESLWHRSWSKDPEAPPSLDDLLGECHSYGFSFVGFHHVPRGRLAMDELEITPARS